MEEKLREYAVKLFENSFRDEINFEDVEKWYLSIAQSYNGSTDVLVFLDQRTYSLFKLMEKITNKKIKATCCTLSSFIVNTKYTINNDEHAILRQKAGKSGIKIIYVTDIFNDIIRFMNVVESVDDVLGEGNVDKELQLWRDSLIKAFDSYSSKIDDAVTLCSAALYRQRDNIKNILHRSKKDIIEKDISTSEIRESEIRYKRNIRELSINFSKIVRQSNTINDNISFSNVISISEEDIPKEFIFTKYEGNKEYCLVIPYDNAYGTIRVLENNFGDKKAASLMILPSLQYKDYYDLESKIISVFKNNNIKDYIECLRSEDKTRYYEYINLILSIMLFYQTTDNYDLNIQNMDLDYIEKLKCNYYLHGFDIEEILDDTINLCREKNESLNYIMNDCKNNKNKSPNLNYDMELYNYMKKISNENSHNYEKDMERIICETYLYSLSYNYLNRKCELADNPKVDEKWRKELYTNSLYDLVNYISESCSLNKNKIISYLLQMADLNFFEIQYNANIQCLKIKSDIFKLLPMEMYESYGAIEILKYFWYYRRAAVKAKTPQEFFEKLLQSLNEKGKKLDTGDEKYYDLVKYISFLEKIDQIPEEWNVEFDLKNDLSDKNFTNIIAKGMKLKLEYNKMI